MIISDKYRYLFIETPRTASSAISKELCENYGGRAILQKHAHYFEFKSIASEDQKNYFVFSTIRNPLDEIVSLYFKLKTDHRAAYSSPARSLRRGGHVTRLMKKKYDFIHQNNADFEMFFKKFYRLPYNSVLYLNRRFCDFIIRYENLQKDISTVLKSLNIQHKRPLPHVNITPGKKKSYLHYYSPGCIHRARRVFGPFLEDWGYDLPAEWGGHTVTPFELSIYRFVSELRILYWRYVRWGRGRFARIIRRLLLG